ncbi:MAG: hypothetical protein U1G07_01980 [Verrucomicrobiota bacterium]
MACKSQERFIFCFQRKLREALAHYQSAAVGFGPTWEQTLEEVPLEEGKQAQVYWLLIGWAKTAKLFTTDSGSTALSAWPTRGDSPYSIKSRVR